MHLYKPTIFCKAHSKKCVTEFEGEEYFKKHIRADMGNEEQDADGCVPTQVYIWQDIGRYAFREVRSLRALQNKGGERSD